MYSDVWCLFVQLRHLLEFLRVVGSGLPDSSTAGCGSLQMSMLRHAATNPPIFNHRCQCLQTSFHDTEMGSNNSRYSIWNQAECKKILAASLRYQLLRNLLRTGSHNNGLQLLHSSLCDLAIVPDAASVSNPKLLMQVAP